MRIRLLQALMATALVAPGPAAAAAQSETLLYDHVPLAVPNPPEASQWYMDHIGGEPVDGRDDRMLIGTTRFIFQRAEYRRPSTGSVIDHLGFSVADLDAVLSDLESARASVTSPRRDVDGLFPLAFVEDPWGVRFEVLEDPQHLRFHHIHLRSPEPEATRQWYLDQFRGVRIPLRGRLDGILPGNVWVLVTEGDTFPSTEGTIDHIGWRAPEMNTKLDEFDRKGIEVTRGPMDLTFVNGTIEFFFIAGPPRGETSRWSSAPRTCASGT